MKFTQEIKDNWLTALKSGDYLQGYGNLVNYDDQYRKRHCCIGVLGSIVKGLDNSKIDSKGCPYVFLRENNINTSDLFFANDEFSFKNLNRPKDYKDDYSNVIPLIEAIKVIE